MPKWSQLSRSQQAEARRIHTDMGKAGIVTTVSQVAAHWDDAQEWHSGAIDTARYVEITGAELVKETRANSDSVIRVAGSDFEIPGDEDDFSKFIPQSALVGVPPGAAVDVQLWVNGQLKLSSLTATDTLIPCGTFSGAPGPRPGRPEVGGIVQVRLGDILDQVDAWREPHGLSRAEAVRRLVADGLAAQ
jgi:hypothetical protein